MTTDEERTGSVGASSAPSRKHSVQPRSVSACAASATIAAVSGIASTSLRNGRCQAFCSISRLDLEPVAEQDHDQRDDRQVGHEARRGSSSSDEPALADANPARTNSAVSERKERRAMPESSAPDHQQHAEHEHRRVEPAGPCRGEHASPV